MTRPPTPDVLGAVLADDSPAVLARQETAELRAALRWNYSQIANTTAAGTVIDHAVEIKRHERRYAASVIEAGHHLTAVKALLEHGQWLDWLTVEFGMTPRTAQNMMAVAEQFGGDKYEKISHLSGSVLYLLTGDSVPEPARAAVVEAAGNGKVTVQQAKAIVAQHRPARPRPVSPPAPEPDDEPEPDGVIVAALDEPDDEPIRSAASTILPATYVNAILATEPPAPAVDILTAGGVDPRVGKLAAVRAKLSTARDALTLLDEVTGRYSATGECRWALAAMVEMCDRELEDLQRGRPREWGEL